MKTTQAAGLVPGLTDDSKTWKEMEDGDEKRAAFLREMEPFLRESKLPLRPAPHLRVARKSKVVVGANFLLLAIFVVGYLLYARR